MNHVAISMCVAMDLNRGIGRDGETPWGRTVPSDLSRFHAITVREKVLICGSTTFVSIIRQCHGPLKDRTTIVLTHGDRIPYIRRFGGVPANSVKEALSIAARHGRNACVIGGGSVYDTFLPLANRLYLTTIQATFDGVDTVFPLVDLAKDWAAMQEPSSSRRIDSKDVYASSFGEYVRRIGH